jgi:signal transduction histidine kinase
MNGFRRTKVIGFMFRRDRPNSMRRQTKHLLRRTSSGSVPLIDPLLVSIAHYSSALLLVVFCLITIVGIWIIRDLHTANLEAQKMYAGSVLGLRRIGELQYEAQETRRATFYALTTNDSNLQLEYADESREADRLVKEGIIEYLRQAQTPREIEIGKRLEADWSDFLKVRNEVLSSILEGSTKEAVALDLAGGVQSFDRVRQDMEEIKRLYDEQASQRLANVVATSRRFAIRLIAVLAFTLIFASASVWAIQRSKMLAALQFAELQIEFVASVSHELRTPLAVISSAADNIVDGLVNKQIDVRRYGTVIQKQSRQISDLVNQILLFATTQDRRSRYALRPLQISAVIESVLDNTSELLHDTGFLVERQIQAGLPRILSDPSALSQCLQNLIVNAVKYSGESRWIGIRAVLADTEHRAAQEIQVVVQDRGIGIERSELSHIFEPFYRSAAVSDAQIHGAGLGLSLARDIAEAMGGRLTVISELGRGSSFTLHLPLAQEQDLRPAVAAMESPSDNQNE